MTPARALDRCQLQQVRIYSHIHKIKDEEEKKILDRRIDSFRSTCLTPAQTRYSPVQLETLAIDRALYRVITFVVGLLK